MVLVRAPLGHGVERAQGPPGDGMGAVTQKMAPGRLRASEIHLGIRTFLLSGRGQLMTRSIFLE